MPSTNNIITILPSKQSQFNCKKEHDHVPISITTLLIQKDLAYSYFRFRCNGYPYTTVDRYIEIEFDINAFDVDYFRRFVRCPDQTSNSIRCSAFSVIDVYEVYFSLSKLVSL